MMKAPRWHYIAAGWCAMCCCRTTAITGRKRDTEMSAIEQALAENRRDDIPRYLTDRWIADNALYGSAAKVRDRLAEWYAAGLNTPVLVPNSVNGNQLTALDEIFAAFAD